VLEPHIGTRREALVDELCALNVYDEARFCAAMPPLEGRGVELAVCGQQNRCRHPAVVRPADIRVGAHSVPDQGADSVVALVADLGGAGNVDGVAYGPTCLIQVELVERPEVDVHGVPYHLPVESLYRSIHTPSPAGPS
jgi:hypothetical protein